MGILQTPSLTSRTLIRHIGLSVAILLTGVGCAVKSEKRVSAVPSPPRVATPAELIQRINSRSESIHTLVATVELEPTAGSVYSGVIKEYRDVRGFILLEAPNQIRMLGQAPVVRTTLFDMVSDGREFRLSIPPKNKFIVGRADFRRAAKNSLENLRPQHIMDALLLPGLDAEKEKFAVEEAEEGMQRFYVVSIVEPAEGGELALKRKVWFERANLDLARLQIYGAHGAYLEDVYYAAYQDFGGVNFPSRIEIRRPIEDYRLTIRVEKATFNQPIAAEKFELNKPEGAELIELGKAEEKEATHDQ